MVFLKGFVDVFTLLWFQCFYPIDEIQDLTDNVQLRWPGIEPGSTPWKGAMLATIPPSPQKHENMFTAASVANNSEAF